ncbi:hypothetical protein Efla_005574 [Eimeria flavescens]
MTLPRLRTASSALRIRALVVSFSSNTDAFHPDRDVTQPPPLAMTDIKILMRCSPGYVQHAHPGQMSDAQRKKQSIVVAEDPCFATAKEIQQAMRLSRTKKWLLVLRAVYAEHAALVPLGEIRRRQGRRGGNTLPVNKRNSFVSSRIAGGSKTNLASPIAEALNAPPEVVKFWRTHLRVPRCT